jgi:hypothetical protein
LTRRCGTRASHVGRSALDSSIDSFDAESKPWRAAEEC